MSIKEIINAERGKLRTHARKGTQHHVWGESALDRIEAAVTARIVNLQEELDGALAVNDVANRRISELEVKVEAYRQANGSKAARIEKMKEQYEEDARNWKQRIAELEETIRERDETINWYINREEV